MEEYRDLDLTLEVFTALLAEPEFHELEAGIVLQAYLPDSVAALDRLIEFAERAGRGGWRRHQGPTGQGRQPVDGGASTPSSTAGRTAPYGSKAEVDANYLRLVDRSLRPELAGVLRVGVASHNLYDVALAHLLAERRGVSAALDVEMLQGMSPAQARAVKAAVGTVLLYTPVVAPEDFDVAVAYLVRRLEENAQPQNFLYAAVRRRGHAPSTRNRPRRARWPTRRRGSGRRSRRWRRRRSMPRRNREPTAGGTDASPTRPTPIRRCRTCGSGPRSGSPPARRRSRSPVLDSIGDVDGVVAAGRAAQPDWAARPAAERAAILRRAADELEARRGELVTVMAAEGGKTVAEADPEVSEAIDFARYYADRALELEPSGGHAEHRRRSLHHRPR